MADTCQATSMYSQIYSPNILATGSSQVGENSYSVRLSSRPFTRPDNIFKYNNDNDLGVSIIDRYTHYILEFMEGINKTSHTTLEDLVSHFRLA